MSILKWSSSKIRCENSPNCPFLAICCPPKPKKATIWNLRVSRLRNVANERHEQILVLKTLSLTDKNSELFSLSIWERQMNGKQRMSIPLRMSAFTSIAAGFFGNLFQAASIHKSSTILFLQKRYFRGDIQTISHWRFADLLVISTILHIFIFRLIRCEYAFQIVSRSYDKCKTRMTCVENVIWYERFNKSKCTPSIRKVITRQI